MMMMKSFVSTCLLVLSLNDFNGRGGVSVDAFLASSPSSSIHTSAAASSSSSELKFFSGFEMGGMDAVNNEKKNTKGDSSSNSSSSSMATSDESQDALFLASLVTKAIIILTIKMAKDIVNYPPNLLDQYNRYQQVRNQEIVVGNTESSLSLLEDDEVEGSVAVAAATAIDTTSTTTSVRPGMVGETPLPFELTKTNPFILLAKFLGVLTYKSMHDAIYYPALWIHNYLYPPRNDDDYYYYY